MTRNDSRPFITITVDMPRHPKFAALTKGQKFLIVEAWCHCGEYLTDGVVDPSTWRGLATKRDRDAVLRAGVAVEFKKGEIVEIPSEFRPDADRIRTEYESNTGRTLPTDCVLFLGYLDHQSKRSDVEAMREKRRSAGQKGGQAKARNASKPGDNGVASATARGNQNGGKSVPEKEVEGEVLTDVSTSKTPSTAPQPTANANPPGFVEFWAAYPRRTDKGGARKAYAKATARTDPAAILEGARRFAADPNLPEPQYIPHAATWLNGERWTDEPLPPRYRPNAAPGPQRPNRLTPAEIKFAEAEALKDDPDPRILAAAGIPMPDRGIRELNVWDSVPAIEAS
ncbi:hypothetical protein [Nocardia bovistercoris]|uniref:Uncharacterized protein n=1 Tax=Nocardia bovistercoris TaxID=2785916 RepID=A0A931N5L1_9NOCA|nr:hypothetical protein [Nocardia bovistercoris]MBH0778778.1 hypothetical protein [Nocardia bovistercoris]